MKRALITGIRGQDGVLVHDDEQTFCGAVVNLMDSLEERTCLGEAARQCASRLMEGETAGSFLREIAVMNGFTGSLKNLSDPVNPKGMVDD